MKISVVIPVYNVENYLPQCINSILGQDYSDFELLLINDGSTDRSLSVCQEFALKDGRIRIISHTNQGVSATRNLGIKEALGEFVCFIDSDDWVESTYLSNFCLCNSSAMNEFVIQGMFFDKEYKNEKRILNTACYAKSDFIKCFSENDLFLYGTPCCKLFRTKILKENNILFPENISFGEDTLFFMCYLKYVDIICTTSRIAYHYRILNQNSGSLSHIKHDSEKLMQFYKVYYAVVDELFLINESSDNSLFFSFYNDQINGISTAIMNMFRHQYNYKKRKLFYISLFDFYKNKFYLFGGLPLFRKLIIRFLCLNNKAVVDLLFRSIYCLRKICPNNLNPFYKTE